MVTKIELGDPVITPKSNNQVAIKPMSLDDISKIGSGSQTQLANITKEITAAAKTSDMDEIGNLLNNTIMAAKGYDPDNLFKGGLFGFFKAKAEKVRQRFDSVDDSVQKIVGEVNTKINHFRKRIDDLGKLEVANVQFHDSFTPEIQKLNSTADWMEQNVPQPDQNDPMSANKVQEWLTIISLARKRADDLRRAQILAQQQQAQIQQMKTNSFALAQKFDDIRVTTIPALQNTFTLYVIQMEQKKGAEFADMIDATTNDAIQKNAALLGANTTAIHTSLTRSNISIESLKANYDSITNSLNEVSRINAEMKERLALEAPQLEQLSQDLSLRLSSPEPIKMVGS